MVIQKREIKRMKNFENWLLGVSSKFAQNRVLNVIQGAFMMLLPITMVGSIASLLKGVSVGGYQAWLQSTPLYPALSAVYQFSIGLLALYVVFLVGNQYARVYNLKTSGINIGLSALAGFMIVTPYTVPADAFSSATISSQWLGSSGMFTAIILAFVAGVIFNFCEKKNISIKMPDSVPPMVASQFSSLIPTFIFVIICIIVEIVFSFTPIGNIQQAIYSLVSAPLTSITGNIFGQYLLMLILYAMWFFGIHGGMTVGPIIMMLFMTSQMENLAAFQAGVTLPHMVTGTALSYGSGSLPMLLAMLIFAKSKTNKSITKLAILPSFFGVDEPAYFGTPMILNPIFFLPWVVLTPAISVFGTYLLQLIHLLPYATGASAGSFIPFFVTDVVSYGWQGVVWGLVIMALCVLVYIPFVKVYDKQKLNEEAQTEKAAE
jgi:PTS system cellobiose-specific IIC component